MAKKAKPEPKTPILGRWRIVSMSTWDEEYLDEEVEAYLEINDKNGGSFQFGYVQGEIDSRTTIRDGKLAVEWSWEGSDGADGTRMSGRGWAILEGDELKGMFFIHQGDDSEFVATRATEKKAAKRK